MAFRTDLDANQVLRNSHDETTQSLQVKIVSGSTVQLDKVDSPTFTAYSSINGSGGALAVLKTSTAAEIKQIHAFDTTGIFLSLFVGSAGNEVLECVIGPGNDQPLNVNIPAGSRVTIRATDTTAPSAGNIAINYLG